MSVCPFFCVNLRKRLVLVNVISLVGGKLLKFVNVISLVGGKLLKFANVRIMT